MLLSNEVLVNSSKIQMFKFKFHEEIVPAQNINVNIEE